MRCPLSDLQSMAVASMDPLTQSSPGSRGKHKGRGGLRTYDQGASATSTTVAATIVVLTRVAEERARDLGAVSAQNMEAGPAVDIPDAAVVVKRPGDQHVACRVEAQADDFCRVPLQAAQRPRIADVPELGAEVHGAWGGALSMGSE